MISRCTSGLLFFRLEVGGINNIRGLKGPLIITPNHKSYCDHFFVLATIIGNNRNILPARVVAADKFFKIFFMGWALRNLLGAYSTRKGEGLDVSVRNLLRALHNNYMVAIYPEGKMRFEPGIHEIKLGAAYLARKTGVPILPVAIQGIEYLSLKEFLFGRRIIKVLFGKPYDIRTDENLATASKKIRCHIVDLYYQNKNISELPL